MYEIMKKLLKVLLWIGIVLVALIIVLYTYVTLSWKKTYDAPYPEIAASSDPDIIARGKHLAYGPSHCASCHVPMNKIMDVDKGLEIPLSGGWEEAFPGFGRFRAPNLTPDKETGIGNISDAALARSIRYSVGHDGRYLPPFMVFHEMSDEDVIAVISFLRSQEPVKHKVEPSEYGFIAKALLAFGVLKPEGFKNTPPVSVMPDSTAEYGRYLARNVGNCIGCHIKMDQTGKQIGPDFAGGGVFPPSELSAGYAFVSPNLTPHPTTGVITDWSEEAFIHRFKAGRIYKGSPMPWGSYSRMDDLELKALYRFLHSLQPVDFVVEKTVYLPGEKLPE